MKSIFVKLPVVPSAHHEHDGRNRYDGDTQLPFPRRQRGVHRRREHRNARNHQRINYYSQGFNRHYFAHEEGKYY